MNIGITGKFGHKDRFCCRINQFKVYTAIRKPMPVHFVVGEGKVTSSKTKVKVGLYFST